MALHSISEHIWYLEPDHRSDRPALGYICGKHFAFAVDAGASKAHVKLFYKSLEENKLPLPDFTGISHYHWDHSYGAAFVHGITVASDKCNENLLSESQYEWSSDEMLKRLQSGDDIEFSYYCKLIEYPNLEDICVVPANIGISGDMTIDLGGVHVEIRYCKGPHSDDHLIFFVPEDKFLFLSDASGKELFTLDWKYDREHPERLQKIIDSLPYNQEKLRPFVEMLDQLDFKDCCLGHADEIVSKQELLASLRKYI